MTHHPTINNAAPLDTEPTIFTLCEQIGRWIESDARLAMPTLFAELDGLHRAEAGIFATAMPAVEDAGGGGQRRQSERPSTLISVTPGVSPMDANNEVTRRMGVALACSAATERAAVQTLDAVLRLMRPRQQHAALPRWTTSAATLDTTNLRGLPPAWLIGAEGAGAWRTVVFETGMTPQLLPDPDSAEQNYRHRAIIEVIATAAAITLPKPTTAFTLTRQVEQSVGKVCLRQSTVLDDRRLAITNGPTMTTLNLKDFATVGALRDWISANLGGFWDINTLDAAALARSPMDLVAFQTTTSTGTTAIPIAVW